MGLVMAAGANSFVQQYRFAASNYVQDTIKSQAISRVLIGGIAAGNIDAQLVTYNKDLLYPIPFANAFLSGSALLVIGFLVLILLPPQIPETRKTHRKEGRIRREFFQDQTFVTAVLCGTISYALMAFVMTAAPLAIVGCGFGVAEAAVGIQWHVRTLPIHGETHQSLWQALNHCCWFSSINALLNRRLIRHFNRALLCWVDFIRSGLELWFY